MRVLIVEDEALIAMDLEMQVEELGHRSVGYAATAQSALTIARSENPDIALVDLRLADGDDGRAVAATLRSELGVPSILISASLHGLTDTDLGRIVPLALLAKPIPPARLEMTLDRLRGALGAD